MKSQMKCRECCSSNTRVTCTEVGIKETKRWCRCLDCGAKYRTIENYVNPKPGPEKGMPRPGNIAKGESHGSAVLTEKDIRNIRRLHEAYYTHKVIAEKYGISASYVSKIARRKAWTHLT